MKKMLMLSLLTMIGLVIQAQTTNVWYKGTVVPNQENNVIVRAKSQIWVPSPDAAAVDKKTKKRTVVWTDTENNSWHEYIGFVDNVPVVSDIKAIFPEASNVGVPSSSYVPMSWQLTDEKIQVGDGTSNMEDCTILHCYFRMSADIVKNLWLGNKESCILDKETGVIYQARSTIPAACYNKVFSVKGKEGTTLDFQIVFPRLPESAKELAIYGVPTWYMRGWDVTGEARSYRNSRYEYDEVPRFHMAHMVKDSVNYDKNNHESWAVYNDPHLIKPMKEQSMALWLTADATYLAIATEQNWIREYHGRGGNTILLDEQGHQYKCKGVLGYPNDKIFWLEGYPGDYFAMVLVFDPLPWRVTSFTFVVPEGEPFTMWGANWSGEVIPNLEVQKLRNNQKLFEYHPRTVVE